MEDFKKELKELLKKYDATICILTDGEGYSQTANIEIETNVGYLEFKDYESISQDNL